MQKTDDIVKKLQSILTKKSTFECAFIFLMSVLLISFLVALCAFPKSNQDVILFGLGTDLFSDFTVPLNWVKDQYFQHGYFVNPDIFYPAMPLLCFYPFMKIASAGSNSAYLFMSVFMFILAPTIALSLILYELKNGSKLIKIATVFLLLFSGIYIFSIERANIVFYSVVALFLFLSLYRSENKILREVALISLAVAASIKFYPAIFGLLLLADKRYKDIFKTIIYGVLITFIPFAIMKGGLSNLPLYLDMSKATLNGLSYEHPFYKIGLDGLIPFATIFFPIVKLLVPLILPAKILLFIFSIIAIFNLDTYWKKILLLTIVAISTQNPSFTYGCLNLFFALILLLNEKEHELSDWVYLIFLITILSPFQFTASNATYSSIALNPTLTNISILSMQIMLCLEGFNSLVKKRKKKPHLRY